jgi:hypothetical protein
VLLAAYLAYFAGASESNPAQQHHDSYASVMPNRMILPAFTICQELMAEASERACGGAGAKAAKSAESARQKLPQRGQDR